MDWIEFFVKELEKRKDVRFSFEEPAPDYLLIELKERFNLSHLPEELESLYDQTNGIDDYIYMANIDEWVQSGEFIWPVERVIKTNSYLRTSDSYKSNYADFENLLFFADSGSGDHFGFESKNGAFESSDVYVWNHENDHREWVAPSLKAFIEGWFNGSIKV